MPHTMSDIKEAERLWQTRSAAEVEEITGIPASTMYYWSNEGLITKEEDHRKGKPKKYDPEMVRRADRLYDKMPLKSVSKVLDVPHGTLRSWQGMGWIDTDVDWQKREGGRQTKANPRRAIHLVIDQELSHKEAAERMGIAQSTVTRYLQEYKNPRSR